MSTHIGSTLDDWLTEEAMLEETEARALKSVIAMVIEEQLKTLALSKTALAEKLHTSRAAVNRLLDPNNTSITLHSMVKVMHVLGKKLHISIT